MATYNENAISFSHAVSGFRSGKDTPTAFLERCIAAIESRESAVQAFEVLNIEGARAAAEAATGRYRAGQPLSMVDGCPVGIKDIMDTSDMPTQMGSPVFKGWQPAYDHWARKPRDQRCVRPRFAASSASSPRTAC